MRISGIAVDAIAVRGAVALERERLIQGARTPYVECVKDWCHLLRTAYPVNDRRIFAQAISWCNDTTNDSSPGQNLFPPSESQLLDWEALSSLPYGPDTTHTLQDVFRSCLSAEMYSGIDKMTVRLSEEHEYSQDILPFAVKVFLTQLWYRIVEKVGDGRYTYSPGAPERKCVS